MLIFSTLGFVVRRAWHHRAILLPVVLGVLGVVTILCGVPLFSTAATGVALQDTLHAPAPLLAHNVEIRIEAPPFKLADYEAADRITGSSVSDALGSDLVHQPPIRRGLLSGMALYPAGDTHHFPQHLINQSDLWFFSPLSDDHLHLLAGRFPSPTITTEQTPDGTAYNIEALLAQEWADQYQIRLNDVREIAAAFEQPDQFLRVHFVGFFQPKSLSDPFWFGDLDPFTQPISVGDEPLPPMPIILSEATFTGALPLLKVTPDASYLWFFYLHLDSITPGTASDVANRIVQLRNQMESLRLGNAAMLSQLDGVMDDFLQRLFFVQVVTLVAILPGLALLLLYLLTAAGALAEHSRAEIALMKSRGASAWQMFSLLMSEALLLCAAALLLAPWLAGQATIILIKLGLLGIPPERASFALGLPTLQSYLFAGAAAALCLLTLFEPALGAVRSSMLAVKQYISRPRLRALSLRVGPGLLLAALGVFGYVQIRQRGLFFTQNLQGDFSVDWVAALSPTFLLLGVGGLGLLLIPPALTLLDRLGHRLPGVAFSLALRQMSRRPAPYTRLILLLALTISLGLFAALFNGTIDSSFADRAAYISGADLRLDEGDPVLPAYDRQAAPLQDHLSLLPGATDGMNAFRINVDLPGTALQFDHATTLAIDSARFAQIAYWRPDFADTPLSTLTRRLRQPISAQEAVPALVDDRLLQDSGKRLGDDFNAQISFNNGVTLEIVGVYHYFPTLDTSQYSIVCDLNRLLEILNKGLTRSAPNEVWLKLAANAPIYTVDQVAQRLTINPQKKQVVVNINQAFDRRALVSILRSDSLHLSISSALTLDFIIAALLSVVGFVALFYLIAKQRAFEFGVLRAMGLSLRQLTHALGWEQGLLLALSLLLGVPLGYLVAAVTLPPLSTDDTGIPFLPPLVARLNAPLVAKQGMFLLICLLAALLATTVIFRRLRVQEVLRLGEE